MASQGGGKIINIASMLSFQGGIIVPSYTAAKSGVAGLTWALANEWAGHNINVNAIAPGYMATDNTAPLRADKERSASILSRIPAGRWGTPDDLKGVGFGRGPVYAGRDRTGGRWLVDSLIGVEKYGQWERSEGRIEGRFGY